MSRDDKHRVIGKVVAITSDRFTVELLSGIENFNINGFDDIHYFAQVNSYVILPYQNYHIVAEIISIRERDTILANNNPIEQSLNKSKSVKYIEISPLGTIKENSFIFGVSVYPPLYSDVLYIKQKELDCIFNTTDVEIVVDNDSESHEENTRLQSLSIGRSSIFENYDIKIDINSFFASHSSVLGNTGSGKSCTIASMIQGLVKKKSYSSIGATFIVLDVNGEYQQAFSKVNEVNNEVDVINFTIDEVDDDGDSSLKQFHLPHWFLNIDEWALLLQASEKTQLPILRNALALAVLFSKNKEINNIKNHILSTCITQILRDETSSPSKKDRIKSILQKFYTDEISLSVAFKYTDDSGALKSQFHNGISTVKCTIENCLFIHFGEMKGVSYLHQYLEQKDEDGCFVFLSDEFSLPSYKPNQKFDFNLLEDALDIAILYEESYGNRQIRDYCSSMITRFKSLQERDDFNFLKSNVDVGYKIYRNKLLGICKKKGVDGYMKKSQITIIDLNSAEDEIVEVVSCVVSRIIYEAIKFIEPRNSFPVNLILEEAHRYISINQERLFLKANHIFERIAKEGRKYGMFLMVSSQRPSELSKTVLSQCSNFIVHRIQNPEDLSHIKKITPHISDAILKRLPSIPTQQALVFGHAVNLPAIFKVNTANPLPKSDNNNISRNWFRSKDTILEIKFNK